MKSSITRFILIFAVIAVVLAGCKERENANPDGVSETIAPAEPQPAATGTEAMTETVNIEDSRSEAEGAALNKPGASATDTTATTVTTTTPPSTATR